METLSEAKEYIAGVNENEPEEKTTLFLRFVKMQGCGNDYIYFDCFEQTIEEPEALAVKLSDRHFGIGGDGIVLICPSDVADVKMRMFNIDGSGANVRQCDTLCRQIYV